MSAIYGVDFTTSKTVNAVFFSGIESWADRASNKGIQIRVGDSDDAVSNSVCWEATEDFYSQWIQCGASG